MVEADSVFRAMTDDGTFRVLTLKTTDTVRRALAAQDAAGPTARAFGDLITGAILLRLTLAPQLRVQGILRGSGSTGTIVADSHPSGRTRGLVSKGRNGEPIDLGPGSLLRLMRTMHDGRLHQGVVEVAGGAIAPALMTYMQVSEQVTTMIAVGTVFDETGLVSSGGYLVQLLPGAERGPLLVMAERLEEFRTIDHWLVRPAFTPGALMGELLYGMPFTELGASDVRFECWCSQVTVMSSLSTLPRTEVQSMIDDGEVLEIQCDYCNAEYRVSPGELRGLVETS
ncbi:MAG TPA: Hsp33 family molecular chaperone HslO [Polyangiaceae bacterium]|jgi:molecular chaperone Hsp33|nr:Hsp33 family molecular chaperone HslO [Polyangiaceae bacterium]